MNPAILVLLWIRLSVTFGYPAAYTGLPPRIRTRERISPRPSEYDRSYTMPAAQDYDDSETTSADSKLSTSSFLSPSSSSSSRTSPHFMNDDSTFEEKPAFESSKDTTRIISIVRVSASTSVVKPKRLERVTKSVSESRNYLNTVSIGAANDAAAAGNGLNETNLENVVTPFISLLRKNRFDVYENDGPETLDLQQYAHRSASSTSAASNYTESSSESTIEDFTSRYRDENNDAVAAVAAATAAALHRQSESINDTNDATEMVTEQYTLITETDRRTYPPHRREKSSSNALLQLYEYAADQRVAAGELTERNYEQPEEVYGEPERVYGESEKVYGETERVYGQAETVYGEPEKEYGQPADEAESLERTYDEEEKYKSETMHDEPETEEEFVKQNHHFGLGLPESGAAAGAAENANSYSLFTTRVNDKKSSFIVDNGTHRKYRVEEKTPDGFIVGEYGMVSHRDGSLRGVRYTADSNINPSLIYQTLVKFLSLK